MGNHAVMSKHTPSRIKVLHLLTTLDWSGGIETYLLSLLPLLEAEGHPQGVAFAKGNPELIRFGRCIPALNKLGNANERVAEREVANLINEFRPDIVHVHNVNNIGAIGAALRVAPTFLHAHGYKFICPVSDLYFRRSREICQRSCGPACFPLTMLKHCMSPRPPYVWQYYRRARWAIKNASDFAGVIAPSRYAAERYIRAGFPENRTSVIPYFCPVPTRSEPRNEPKIPTILFIGRIRAYKGMEYFVQCLGMLPSNVQGVIVGDASEAAKSQIAAWSRQANCADRLTVRAWVRREELPDLMDNATILVFPSTWPETLGIVGLEALAHGVPVVACDVGGVREWLQPGKTGLLVAPKNAAALASACSQLLGNERDRRDMGRFGIQLMCERFSRDRHVVDLLSTYQRVL